MTYNNLDKIDQTIPLLCDIGMNYKTTGKVQQHKSYFVTSSIHN